MRSRTFTTLFASALLLSASLFLAPSAFAADPDVCPKDNGWTKVNGSSGSVNLGNGASISWGGGTLDYDIPAGGTLQICIKAASVNAKGGGGTDITTIQGPRTGRLTTANDSDAISLGGHDISHISYIFTFVPPGSTTVTATASIGAVRCGATSVTVTLGSTGTSDFTVTVGSITRNFDDVTGSGNTETIDLSSLADGNYTVTVSSADLASNVTQSITIERDCPGPDVAAAAVAGDCETLSAVVEVSGNEGDEFTVTLNGTQIDTIVLGASGEAEETYDLPEDAVSEIQVGGAATAVDTVDCTVGVEDVVIERPEDPDDPVVDDEVEERPADPVADPVADDVAEDDEVEVKPQVLAKTGDHEDRLLVIALLLMGLGLPLTLVQPRWQRIDER